MARIKYFDPESGKWKYADQATSKSGNGTGGNGADGFSPIANVTQTDDGAVISITDKTGTTEAIITNGKDGEDGKSAYQYATDGGYTGTEAEFAEKLAETPLTGTTADITPTQVAEAIATGKDVAIAHTGTLGRMLFTNFGKMDMFDVIASSAILNYDGTQFVLALAGQLSTNQWFMSNPVGLATKDDIPSALPNPERLTFKPGTNLLFSESIPIVYDGNSENTVYLPTKTSHLENDSGFLTAIPSALKNPYALNINGTVYDGSKEVTMTIQGGGDSIPEYVRAEAERVAKVVQSRQNANTITFLACSDIHYYSPDNATPNVNSAYMKEAAVSMGQAMRLMRERVHIDFAAMFGDMTWDYGETKEEQLAEMRFVNDCLYNGFHGIPQLRMEGNHDDAYESNNDLTAAEVFSNIGAWNNGAVYGDRAAGYCYRDFEGVKLRVIALNSSQYSGSAAQFNPEQVTWLANALDLSNRGADWRSIILSHHPLDWGRNGGTDPTATIKAASGLIASFHGHIHNFLTGTVTNADIPRIAIPNAGYSRENQYGESYGINWKESTTYSKTPGTAQNTSFCIVTIDLAAKKIYADHYGAGYDRIIPYDDVVLDTFTVTNNLTQVTNSNQSAVVEEGKAYSATLSVANGYEMKSISITMGGADITSTVYSNGKITISSVTGNIVITAVAQEIQSVTYTNLVTSSIDPATGEIYGEDYNLDGTPDGYKNGKYASGGNEGNDDTCVLTGLIAYGTDNTNPIYIKGADITDASHCRILGFDATKTASFQAAQGAAISTYFAIENLGTSYYKLTPTSEFKTSAGFKDYLRFSLIGEGENLIITIGEPIE